MKVLAINGSPLKEKGNTARILQPFLDGLSDSGAGVEILYTRDLQILPCLEDFNCWLKTPGHCAQQDDMEMVHLKLRAAEVWVFATPVFVWGTTGPLKNLMDRMLPLVEPFITLQAGHCSHPMREGTPHAKVVLVSSCGFWEMDNFDPLLAQMRTLCRVVGLEFAGALLRPHAPGFCSMLEMGAPVHDVLEAAHAAGRELAAAGSISSATMAAVSRPVLARDDYLHYANQGFRVELDKFAKAAV